LFVLNVKLYNNRPQLLVDSNDVLYQRAKVRSGDSLGTAFLQRNR